MENWNQWQVKSEKVICTEASNHSAIECTILRQENYQTLINVNWWLFNNLLVSVFCYFMVADLYLQSNVDMILHDTHPKNFSHSISHLYIKMNPGHTYYKNLKNCRQKSKILPIRITKNLNNLRESLQKFLHDRWEKNYAKILDPSFAA